MGFFDKKYCDICGDKIGLLGNRKLADGNLCKNCAAKLSYWFSDRKESTVEEIRQQLAYREENLEQVRAFHTTRTIGNTTKIYVDEDNSKFMVVRTGDPERENADILSFDQVLSCRMDIKESSTEKKTKDKDGKSVSFTPRRYEYSYDFHIYLDVTHPYFDDIHFRVNSSSVRTGERRVNYSPSITRYANADYQKQLEACREICDFFDGIRERRQEAREAAAQPKIKIKCEVCGATDYPDDGGCCQFCGSPLKM